MYKRMVFLWLLSCLLLNDYVYAHPGNTDSSGGHTCQTNCEEWGYSYDEYHYHNSYSSEDHYTDGYTRGHEYAYSYTSQCIEDYEWWWEGPQEFGNGYEDGIEEGHKEGLEVCYEDSFKSGYDSGYSDYENSFGYDGASEDFNEVTFEEGYSEGWSDAESKDSRLDSTSSSNTASVNTTSDDSTLPEKDDEAPFDKDMYLYNKAYDEGFETAVEDSNYDDYLYGSNVQDQEIYTEGYRVGYFEGGGGSPFEVFGYIAFEKHPLWTLGLSIFSLMFIWARLKK